MLGITMLINKSRFGHVSPASTWPKGIFLQQLISVYPFPIDAVGFNQSWSNICQNFPVLSPPLFIDTGRWLAALIIFAAYLSSVWNLLKQPVRPMPSQRENELRLYFDLVGLISVVLVLGTLLYLTVRYVTINVIGSESRYYAMLQPFILVSVTETLCRVLTENDSRMKQALRGGLLFISFFCAMNLFLRPRSLFLKQHYLLGTQYGQLQDDISNFHLILIKPNQRACLSLIWMALGKIVIGEWSTHDSGDFHRNGTTGEAFDVNTSAPINLVFAVPLATKAGFPPSTCSILFTRQARREMRTCRKCGYHERGYATALKIKDVIML